MLDIEVEDEVAVTAVPAAMSWRDRTRDAVCAPETAVTAMLGFEFCLRATDPNTGALPCNVRFADVYTNQGAFEMDTLREAALET